MNRTNRWVKNIGFVCSCSLLGLLTGCTIYEEPPRGDGAYYEADGSYVEIRSESDFYEPLSPYGRWEVIGSYGRCWIPGGVDAGWSPYSNGYWQQTDAGWYWASDEPWGWATYHYGRWDLSPQFGWYWVPQTQWAPAWVTWRQGDGCVGWAPLGTSMRVGDRGGLSHGYVFVEERQFLEPVRSRTVHANDDFINRTVDLTRTRTVNRTVVNEGPGAAAIEQASGRRIQAAPVRDLRTRDEPKIATRNQNPTHPQNVQGPVQNDVQPPGKRFAPTHEPKQVGKPAPTTPEPPPPAVKREVSPPDQRRVTKPAEEKRVPPQPEGPKVVPPPPSGNSRPDISRRDGNQGQNHPKEVEKRPDPPAKRSEGSNQKAPPVSEQHARPEPTANDQNGKSTRQEDHKQKDEN